MTEAEMKKQLPAADIAEAREILSPVLAFTPAERETMVTIVAAALQVRSAKAEPLLLDVVERNQELLSLIERFLDDCCDADSLLVNVRAAMSMNVAALKKGGRIQ